MRSLRTLTATTASAAFLLGLVACGGSGGSGGDSSEIAIGFFAPKTGTGAADGQSAQSGATAAVKEINSSGGIDGRKLKLVSYDDASDPKQGASIATKLVTQDHVAAVVSGSYSPQTLAAASIFQRNNIPMISAYAVNPGIPATGDFIFQSDFNGVVQGRAGAQVINDKLNGSKPAIVSIDNDFGNALLTGFKEQAKRLGMTIVSEDKNQFGETNFEPAIRRAKSKGADSVYLVQYVAEGKQFLQARARAGANLPVVSTEGIDSAGFIDSIGPAANGMLFTTNLNRDSTSKATTTFLTEYQKANKYSPDMVAASSHDAVMLLAEGMKKGGTDSEDIRNGLLGLKDFTGATGTMKGFTDGREVIKPVQLQQFKDGKIVSAGQIADSSIITP